MKKGFLLFLLLSLLIMVPICTVSAADDYGSVQEQEAEQKADEVYSGISDKLPSADSDDVVGSVTGRVAGGTIQTTLRAFYSTYQAVKAMAGVLLALTLLTGVAIIIFAQKNKKIKRIGVITFIFVIPVLLWMAVYGVGILNGKFLGAVYDPTKDNSGEYNTYLQLRQFYNIFQNDQKFTVNFLNTFTKMYSGIRQLAYVLVALSIVIGIVTFILNKYNKRQQRRALAGFIIGLPIALLVVINGVSHFNKIFM